MKEYGPHLSEIPDVARYLDQYSKVEASRDELTSVAAAHNEDLGVLGEAYGALPPNLKSTQIIARIQTEVSCGFPDRAFSPFRKNELSRIQLRNK